MIAYQTDDSVSDHKIEEWFESVIGLDSVNFGTTAQLDRLRLGHVVGEIDLKEVVTYNLEHIPVDRYGNLENWPQELSNYTPIIRKLAKAAIKLRKKEYDEW